MIKTIKWNIYAKHQSKLGNSWRICYGNENRQKLIKI